MCETQLFRQCICRPILTQTLHQKIFLFRAEITETGGQTIKYNQLLIISERVNIVSINELFREGKPHTKLIFSLLQINLHSCQKILTGPFSTNFNQNITCKRVENLFVLPTMVVKSGGGDSHVL